MNHSMDDGFYIFDRSADYGGVAGTIRIVAICKWYCVAIAALPVFDFYIGFPVAIMSSLVAIVHPFMLFLVARVRNW